MFTGFPTALRLVLAAFLWPTWRESDINATATSMRFQLRHEHAVAEGSRSVFTNVPPSFLADYYEISTKNIKTHRPPSAAAYSDARLLSMRHAQTPAFTWDPVEVPGPDVTKRQTLLQLATMTHNSYYGEPGHKSWYPLEGWNAVSLSMCGLSSC